MPQTGIVKFSSETRHRPCNPPNHLFLPQHFQQMIQARAVGIAGGGKPRRVNEHAHFHTEFGWLRCRFQPAQARSFGLALHQTFDAQVVIQCGPFDAVACADGLAVFPLGIGRVQERRIIGERYGQHPTIHQLDRQGVG